MQEFKDYWSEGGMIYFTGGNGYAVGANLATLCAGAETDILDYLKGSNPPDSLNPLERQALIRAKELEDKIGANTGTTDMERGQPFRITRHRKKNTGQLKKSKRLSIR